eukprot:gene37253-48701_t
MQPMYVAQPLAPPPIPLPPGPRPPSMAPPFPQPVLGMGMGMAFPPSLPLPRPMGPAGSASSIAPGLSSQGPFAMQMPFLIGGRNGIPPPPPRGPVPSSRGGPPIAPTMFTSMQTSSTMQAQPQLWGVGGSNAPMQQQYSGVDMRQQAMVPADASSRQQHVRRRAPPSSASSSYDPLDPTSQGYLERFGAKTKTRDATEEDEDEEEQQQVDPSEVYGPALPDATPLPCGPTVQYPVALSVSSSVEESRIEVTYPPSSVNNGTSTAATFTAPKTISIEEIMRRRFAVPDKEESVNVSGSEMPCAGPAAGPPSLVQTETEEINSYPYPMSSVAYPSIPPYPTMITTSSTTIASAASP